MKRAMKKRIRSGLCWVGLICVLPSLAHAHGGNYRGPEDVVPPGGGGGGRSGGPAGPTTGGPSAPGPSGPTSGPSTGGPPGSGGGRNPSTGGRGFAVTEDFTNWDYWWEFNKDPFLRLRDAVLAGGPTTGSDDFWLGPGRRHEGRDALRPTADQIQGEILPALRAAMLDWERHSGQQPDIPSSCMVAMAKIGENHPDFRLVDVFRPWLRAGNQELRESAALAVGIAAIAGEAELTLLVDLVLANDAGKAISGGAINPRTRTFAAYGLGLLAHASDKLAIQRRAFDALRRVLEEYANGQHGDRNLAVGAIQAIAISRLAATDATSDGERELLDAALDTLKAFYARDVGSGEQLIQAHCPPAIAKLLGRAHPRSGEFKELFASDLADVGKRKRSSIFIPQSCAMALGQLCQPHDSGAADEPDRAYSKLLLDTWQGHQDAQTRNFAMLALGSIGGRANKAWMLREFDQAKNQGKPWCALALGIYSHARYAAQSGEREQETFITETLHAELKAAKDPNLVGALAIALGLNRGTAAADDMLQRLLANLHQEQMAGYLAVGLALMNHQPAREPLRSVLPQATRRFSLLQQTAIALGKLGDKRVAEDLQKLMTDGEPNLARLGAIASAIGFIGDARTIKPLRAMLFDDKLTELSRAFAAVALGGIADKELLPWNAKIAANVNYRAAVETLTNSQSGILDIL
jgi:hypothetical protein